MDIHVNLHTYNSENNTKKSLAILKEAPKPQTPDTYARRTTNVFRQPMTAESAKHLAALQL